MKTSNKLLLGLLAFICISIITAACIGKRFQKGLSISGSGKEVTEQRTIATFKKVKILGGFKVSIDQGSGRSITIKGYENIVPLIETNVENDELKIKHSNNIDGELPTIHLTVETLEQLKGSGGCQIVSTILTGKALKIKGSGGASLDLNLVYDSLQCESEAGSAIKLNGSSKIALIKFESGASLNASSFKTVDCKAKGESGGNGEIFVSGQLDAIVSSGASLEYLGNPRFGEVRSNSGGSIERKN